ncbi:AraC family transcriptional regulator [Ruminococcaceae bacterium OttesenSCG-928-D13]|nr:AraC family transcriptional regulator [Ruminococcaceae bacterium OttesenSCG-928-D13]
MGDEAKMIDETKKAAEQMRRYIVEHLGDEALSPARVCAAAGYSLRHGGRLFRHHTGRGIGEYIRLLRLSAAARTIAEGDDNVLDVALAHQYDTHEGFTKAFTSAFGVSPAAHRRGSRPIPYFIPYPVSPREALFKRKEKPMEPTTITATIAPRPARKLMTLYSASGTDYWSFCQEQGCDWEGLLLSVKGRLDIPALITLPPNMVPAGKAIAAVAVELPADYAGEVPKGYELADMPAGEMIYFQSPPYEDEEAFAEAISAVFAAYESYDPALFGYEFATDSLPVFNFGAFASKGARIAVPVKKL